MGAALQQRVGDAWQPLAFFSRKLNPAQKKYSAYDRELLAIYEAVRHFRHMLEARHFTILTDHKPLTFAFHQKRDRCSPRQFNHLDYISPSPSSPLTSGTSADVKTSWPIRSRGSSPSPRQYQSRHWQQRKKQTRKFSPS
jgi:hypothetical protein